MRPQREIEKMELQTASEAILNFGLNWRVGLHDVVIDGKVSDEYKAVVREDTGQIFQVAGSRYLPIQNVDSFKFFDEIVSDGQAKYVNGGSYKGGAVTWLRAKVPYDFSLGDGDDLQTYFKIIGSHDGSHKLSIACEVFALLCSNGMWGFKTIETISAKHTENAKGNLISRGKISFEKQIQAFQEFRLVSERLVRTQMTNLEIDSFLNQLFKTTGKKTEDISTNVENSRAQIQHLIKHGTGQDRPTRRGTAWGVYNAVTEFVDRYKTTKGENADYSIDFGSGAKLREEAFELLTVR